MFELHTRSKLSILIHVETSVMAFTPSYLHDTLIVSLRDISPNAGLILLRSHWISWIQGRFYKILTGVS